MLYSKQRAIRLTISTLVLLVISQVIFWNALGFAESRARPGASPGPDTVEMRFADEDGKPLPGLAAVDVPLMPEPGYLHVDPERHPRALFAQRFDYLNTDADYGVYLGWSRRIVDVRLNGIPLKTQSPTDIWGILGGFEPVVYSFPKEYLQQGENTLEMLNSGRSRKILPYFFIGDLSELYSAHNWSRIFSVDLALAAIGVMSFVILLCVLISWPAQDRLRVRALVLLLAAWTLRNLTFLGIDGGLPDPFRLLSHFIVTYLFLFAFLVFALGWTRRPLWTFKATAAAFVVTCIVASIATAVSEQTLFNTAFLMETTLTLAIGAAVLLLFADYWIDNEQKDTIEIVLFLVCMSAVVADAIDDRWQIAVPFTSDLFLTFYAAPMCGLLLALGMVASLAAQSTRARIATENVNELLTSRLQEQEERLTRAYEREKEIEKQKVLVDERQRIIRDMHDGVGGSMISLLLMARRNELTNEQLIDSLNATMSDLRLIIDSFDHVGDNLEFALSIFRQRIEPLLKSHGTNLHFETSAAEAISGFGPESVLQIYRLLQEACNNAVNHGDAKNITIKLSTDDDERTITVAVIDDGSGMDVSAASNGRGLDNMRHRARALNGDVRFESDDSTKGTRVIVEIPMRDEPAAQSA